MVVASVGIIGGGPSGLIALYECHRLNLNVTLYEKDSHFGGVWNFNTLSPTAHTTTTFNTSIFNSSYDTNFSLYDFANRNSNDLRHDYTTASEFFEYLNLFVKRFHLDDFIVFNTSITNVDINKDGKFILTGFHGKKSEKTTFIHDYVIIATGRFGQPIIPQEPVISKYLRRDNSRLWHTQLWDPTNEESESYALFNNNNLSILVMGGSHSAGDAIHDSFRRCNKANQCRVKVFWAPTRYPGEKNHWIINRYPYFNKENSLPMDESGSRLNKMWSAKGEENMINQFGHRIMSKNKEIKYNIRRDILCICDTDIIKSKIADGSIEVVSDPIERVYLSSNGKVAFDTNLTKETNVDLVVLATGYNYAEPMVNNKYILEQSKLFRNIVPIENVYNGRLAFLCHRTVIGVYGSSITVTQMEVRWLLYQWFTNKGKFQNILKTLRETKVPTANDPLAIVPTEAMEILAKDMNVQIGGFKSLLSFSSRKRHIALASLLGPWTIHQYKNPSETAEEQNRREEFLLKNADWCFRKAGRNFSLLCRITDLIHCLSVSVGCGFLIYCGLLTFKYFPSMRLGIN